MLTNTPGIVLHTSKFSETSIIVRIYTEVLGLRSYLVKGIRKPRARIRPGLFQPLTLLDLTVYHKEKSTLHSIRDASIGHPYQTLPFDIRKSSVALFTAELLYKSIREEEPNPALFAFVYDFALNLDAVTGPLQHYPLFFTLHLTRFLGFLPRQENPERHRIFNMTEGIFQESRPDHPYYLEDPSSRYLELLLGANLHELQDMKAPAVPRSSILEKMLVYYRLHLSGFPGIRSHEVLHDVLS